MALRFYDTYTRSIQEFKPQSPDEVRLYCCGPTVYDFAHIGNLRTYIFEDGLRRVLEYAGYKVKHVMNITDVGHLVSDGDDGEDKMEKGSRRTGKSAWDIAAEYTKAFIADMAALGILEPTIWCKATDHIKEQIEYIQTIEAKGFTYRTSDGIYFDSAKLPSYGYLARLDKKGLEGGHRVDLRDKRGPTDFALWKFSKPDEQRQMEWPSPWGGGFPGWHIECSAMAQHYLGNFFDIHCGGEDHIPVHHTNEIAQTEAHSGTRLANIWLHGYFLQLQKEDTADKEKVSKSSGDGFLRVELLRQKGFDPTAYRYFCLSGHYRSHLTFSWEALTGAQNALGRLRTWFLNLPEDAAAKPDLAWVKKFQEPLFDDLNYPRALAVIWDLQRAELPDAVKRATILDFDRALGLGLSSYKPAEVTVPENIKAMAEARISARAAKQWAEADRLRKEIAESGYDVIDTPGGGYKVEKKLQT